MQPRSVNHMAPPRVRQALSVALSAGLLLGCSSNGADIPAVPEPVTASQQLRGQLILGGPVADAKVRILTGADEVAADTTMDNGTYSVLTRPVTEQALTALRVEARSCLDQQEKLSCATLSAALAPGSLAAIHRINVRSTLVDRLVRQRGMTTADAEKRVSAYLTLEDGTLAQDPANTRIFSAAAFVAETYREARAAGLSLDQQLNVLVDQLAADPALQRQYKPLLTLNPIVKGIGMELAKGAVGAVGGEIGGRIMASLGLKSDDGAGERHAEVLARFDALNTRMNLLGMQLEQVQAGINATLKRLQEIDLKLADVARSQLAQRLLTQTSGLSPYVEQVKVAMWDLARAGKLKDLDKQANERQRLKGVIADLLKQRTIISSTMNGTVGNPSMVISLVESQFPKEVAPTPNKEVFYGPKTVQAIQDVVRYYDEINTMAYFLFINYYNVLDEEGGKQPTVCPETPAAGTADSIQCSLYYELKSARAAYLALGPQESLPAPNMFLAISPTYQRLPYVIYPAMDGNFQLFGNNTGIGGKGGVTAFMDSHVFKGMGAAQVDEIRNLADWNFMEHFVWTGMFTRFSSENKFLESMVERGAPAGAFITAQGDRAAWSYYAGDSTPWRRNSTYTGFSDSPERAFNNGKLMMYGQMKSKADVERYMGKVLAARFP